jgi:hypothetical protein
MSENNSVEVSVKHSIRKNGFPNKQVQLPFKPVYDSCGRNGTSLANVLENLRKEGIFGIIKGDHILFMPFEKMKTADTKNRGSMDLSWMNSMPGNEGIKNFIKGNMFNIKSSKLAELRKVAENLSEEDKESLYKMLAQLAPSNRK